MNEIKIFDNAEFGAVRTLETADGKVMFCGADVAKALGYVRPNDAISAHCKGAVKCRTLTNGGYQEMNFIPEGDVYRLITHSKLPNAERFETWVFDEVLPTIRKYGGYGNVNVEEVIVKAVTAAVAETVKAMMPLIEKPAPKPDYAEYGEPRHRGGDACGIIGKLEPALRNEVADMITSNRYSYEEIKRFLAEQGVSVSVSSIQRYKKRLYRK